MSEKHRELTANEIQIMESNGCYAQDWGSVRVAKSGFLAKNIRRATFAGEIRLGANDQTIVNPEGVEREAGVYNAELIECSVGDGVFISNVDSYIANYNIESGVYIEGVGRIVCDSESSFGNGVMAATVNENGGRSVPIYNELTAQIAYIIAMYRHRPKMVERMEQMIEEYCKTVRSKRGTISEGAMIVNSNTLKNVNVGSHAIVNCALMLTNGTINSCEECPSKVGVGVEAHDFILAEGAVVDNGSTLNRCFIGEACSIEYGYMVTDSLFFSNSYCSNGEACSIFAGPYTVSHHKSSLLIAGYFLFFNAGSGSNQSNHLFRMGPVHQGIHERGCKFGSSAYIMLPAKEGPFTVVIGNHRHHHNTEYFPYSYLLEQEGRSQLLPGINIRSFGTLRDIDKWKERDKRGPHKRDFINFEEYNPYIGNRILKAVRLSQHMLSKERIDTHSYRNVRIKSVMLNRGLELYRQMLEAIVGYTLSKGCNKSVKPNSKWVDLAGMFAPKGEVEKILDRVESGEYATLGDVRGALCKIYNSYNDHAHAWAIAALEELMGREAMQDDINEIIARGKSASEALTKLRKEDANKDLDEAMQIGYGVDSLDEKEREEDFKNVRRL